MYQEIIKTKKAFTLVELIITITILVILTTIGFISFQGYTKDARDGNRVATLKNIETGLGIYYTTSFKYPKPDILKGQTKLQTGALSISGTTVEYSYLGEIGENLSKELQISNKPKDPLTSDNYLYSTTLKGKTYQIASILENTVSYRENLITKTYAGNNYIAKVEGNHKIEVIHKIDGKGKFITIVPSLIFDVKGSNILNNTGTLSIVNNKSNLPYGKNNNIQTSEKLIKELRGNDLATTVTLQLPEGITLDGSGVLNEWWAKNKNSTNWNKYSTGVILASLGAIDGVTGGANYEKLTSILNGGDSGNVIEKPSYNQEPEVPVSYDIGNSLRFNGSNAYLSRTFGSPTNKNKWTFSTWVKRGSLGVRQLLLQSWSTNGDELRFGTNDQLEMLINSNTYILVSNEKFRDTSTWYHITWVYDIDNVNSQYKSRIYVNGKEITSWATDNRASSLSSSYNGYINRSGVEHTISKWGAGGEYFNGYLSDVYFVDGQALDPTSFGQFDVNGRWIPKKYINSIYLTVDQTGGGTATASATHSSSYSPGGAVDNNPTYSFSNTAWHSGGYSGLTWWQYDFGTQKSIKQVNLLQSNPGYRPASFDIKISNDGSNWTTIKTYTYPSNIITWNSIDLGDEYNARYIRFETKETSSAFNGGAGWVFDEIEILGLAISTPIYGKNGFHLDFSSGASLTSLGLDSAPIDGTHTQANNWTPNNFNTYDQMLDSPSNNFATLNPIHQVSTTSPASGLGNLSFITSTSGYNSFPGSIPISKGKWMWSVVVTGGTELSVGVVPDNWSNVNSSFITSGSYGYGYYTDTLGRQAKIYNGVGSGNGTYGKVLANGDIIDVLLDMDNGTIGFRHNNNDYGIAYSSLTGSYIPIISDGSSANNVSGYINFGQGGQAGLKYCADAGGYFKYCPPAGFKALSTKNLPKYYIENPKQYFDVLTYTGNGSTQTLTGLSFKPDLVWIKNRKSSANHRIYDSVRGAGYQLYSDSTSKQNYSSVGLSSFNNDGFSLPNPTSDIAENASLNNYVAWNWKKSQKSGFDIVKYTGNGSLCRNIPHSLGATPRFMITKNITDNNTNWYVEHRSIYEKYNGQYWLLLNSTNSYFNPGGQAPDNSNPLSCGLSNSTLFNVGYNSATSGYGMSVPVVGGTNWSAQSTNISGKEYITYLWSEVPGYSKFGSYTGNGSTTGDGPFVYTGFKPRFVMIKRVDTTSTVGWLMWDGVRNTFNPIFSTLKANLPNSETGDIATPPLDYLSNGFKLRDPGSDFNSLGGTYIYAAFAELPFK